MNIDPWILTLSAITVLGTIAMGFWSAKKSKTASDFFVAGRSVSVGWNASAISGEYLSAASFMGVAGMVMSSGYDALWYPVCYACGYLFLLLFIAGPLRRFGAYTIPDFAEGRYDSPLFRKIAVIFVLFIGFFYTMPQMKGAGTTFAYIFKDADLRGWLPDFMLAHDKAGLAMIGLPYWVGVAVVGAVITLNVALGGMKGITLVQAFQYWAKMFAISVPIFVLMSVYGHYGKQLEQNNPPSFVAIHEWSTLRPSDVAAYSENLESIQPQQPLNKLEAGYVGPLGDSLKHLGEQTGKRFLVLEKDLAKEISMAVEYGWPNVKAAFEKRGFKFIERGSNLVFVIPVGEEAKLDKILSSESTKELRKPLPEKAPADQKWISPFGPLTTKAVAKSAAANLGQPDWSKRDLLNEPNPVNRDKPEWILGVERIVKGSKDNVQPTDRVTYGTGETGKPLSEICIVIQSWAQLGHVRCETNLLTKMIVFNSDKIQSPTELVASLEESLGKQGVTLIHASQKEWWAVSSGNVKSWLKPFDTKPYALLYTYSLIIALVCGTAGLPHILVRFYTNPDGVAAKRTTMWVMILIGVFYVFPPVFGVMGRNLLPELYLGTGSKGTDKVVLELPRILNERGAHASGVQSDASRGGLGSTDLKSDERESGATLDSTRGTRVIPIKGGIPWGSILSGITCAGAFAAFMSTFSGLLVSMTGALAHDVYGRILRPKSTPEQRMRMFKFGAVLIGGIAIFLGMQVEQLEINFMVGQAFAIAAASYFPLLFMSVWWRGMTIQGASVGMLSGGLLALGGITLTSVSDIVLKSSVTKGTPNPLQGLEGFWIAHPGVRILCEQPAIWAVPLAIGLMIVVSKLTKKDVPPDVRAKMLVLHAPEELGLKQEYIQEHQPLAH